MSLQCETFPIVDLVLFVESLKGGKICVLNEDGSNTKVISRNFVQSHIDKLDVLEHRSEMLY